MEEGKGHKAALGGERGDAVVPTMVFLSRYVVGGVARNVQGNEHLALLPIPFQLPVVGAQEKEGRKAGVIAHRGARPQRRPQHQRQEQSPRRPATALHTAAAAAARPERRSLIQFWRRRDEGAAWRDGEKVEERAERARARSPAEKFRGRLQLPKFLWAAGARGQAADAESASAAAAVRRPASAAACARRPSARPGKTPGPLRTFLKPGARNRPRRRHTCPGRSPAPARRAARARPAPAHSGSLAAPRAAQGARLREARRLSPVLTLKGR